MNRITFRWLLILAVCLLGVASLAAQTRVSGRVVDKATSEPVIGASVTTGEGANLQGTTTDVDGLFSIDVPSSATLSFRSVGYKVITRKLNNAAGKLNLGDIVLESESVSMDAVSVIAFIVPKDRLTPVPVSNIKASDIVAKTINTEFPELMKATPSVYVSRSGGGFGDSRITLRGFDTQNIGVLINGVPVNGMEDGKVYWSNWMGLTDVASFIQVQRGLGASRLGISSVGGTINIVTKNTDAVRGGNVFTGIANDGYLKYGFNVSTGLMENGWAVSFSGSTTSGNGYIDGTNFRGYNYFVNISKKINDAHTLSFSAFGAPQWHNQHSVRMLKQDYEDSDRGTRLNREYGYHNGEVLSSSYNYYHKPQISLSHFWNINKNSSLNTSVYASVASGGGRRLEGGTYKVDDKTYKGMDLIGLNNEGRPYPTGVRTPDGLIDFDRLFAFNQAAGDDGSRVIFANSVNDHKWFGLLSSYRNRINENFTVTGGIDGRYYRGYHYKEVSNLLGGKYFKGQNLWNAEGSTPPLKTGDRFGYDNIGEVVWSGMFAQGEYTNEIISAFLSGSVTYEGYRFHNPGGIPLDKKNNYKPYDKETKKGSQVSDFVNFIPVSIKGGLSYKFLEYNNVFVNAGYFTRAPNFGGTFLNYGITVNEKRTYEKVLTFELGYGFRNDIASLDLNGYYTKWTDRFVRRNGTGDDNGFTYNFRGLNAIHMGVEMEGHLRPVEQLELSAMASIGNWRWSGNAEFDVYNKDQEFQRSDKINIDKVHVGNAAQLTFALGAKWKVFKDFQLAADLNFFGNNYADFDPAYRVSFDSKTKQRNDFIGDSWKMPNYAIVDLTASYRFPVGKTNASVFGGVNNLLDTKYISDARERIVRKDGMALNNGDTNTVFYGFGRTWQIGMRVNF